MPNVPKRRRFLSKLPDGPCLTVADLSPEDAASRKAVYLITLPALRQPTVNAAGNRLVCPSKWTHEQVAHAVLQTFQQPMRNDPRARHAGDQRPATPLLSFVVFREHHTAVEGTGRGPAHWHIAIRAPHTFRFAPYKKAMQERHGLASHWSTTHAGYWSAVRYGAMPSPTKPQESLDPTPYTWSQAGAHVPLFEACQQPSTAVALQQRREGKVKTAASAGDREPRPAELDLYPIIVQHGFKNTPDDQTADKQLIQWVKAHGTPAMVAFVFKIRMKLPALIDDVWSWETVDSAVGAAQLSRIQIVRIAAGWPCVCNSRWFALALQTLQQNGIDPRCFCHDMLIALDRGRHESLPVMTLMGRYGGEGKSFLLAPLKNVFGVFAVQMAPQRGSFPLLGLETKRVVILDDWCFQGAVIPMATQLLWLEGKPFEITRPQNRDYTGHLLYRGTAPIFITCKEAELGPLMVMAQQALADGAPSAETMLFRRLRVYRFLSKLNVLPGEVVPECASCFARFLFQHGA